MSNPSLEPVTPANFTWIITAWGEKWFMSNEDQEYKFSSETNLKTVLP